MANRLNTRQKYIIGRMIEQDEVFHSRTLSPRMTKKEFGELIDLGFKIVADRSWGWVGYYSGDKKYNRELLKKLEE